MVYGNASESVLLLDRLYRADCLRKLLQKNLSDAARSHMANVLHFKLGLFFFFAYSFFTMQTKGSPLQRVIFSCPLPPLSPRKPFCVTRILGRWAASVAHLSLLLVCELLKVTLVLQLGLSPCIYSSAGWASGRAVTLVLCVDCMSGLMK